MPFIGVRTGVPGAVRAAAASFTPLSGSAIDMDFVGGNYFGGTLANLMDANQTHAIGALLTALTTVSAGSLVISLNPLGAAPTGNPVWIGDSNGDNNLINGFSNTTVRSIANAGNIMQATLGGAATFTGGPIKVGVSWATAARSLVANNGTVVTSGIGFLAGEIDMVFGLNVLTNFKRLTYWNTKLSDAALAALTV